MKKSFTIIIAIIVIAGFGAAWKLTKKETPLPVTNFEECAKAGNPIMESYPSQCRHGNQTFTQDIGNELEKMDLIRIDFPRPNQFVSSPLAITGEARGSWFFEASFPIALADQDGLIIAQGIATAKSNWMTSEFVPFEAELTFTTNSSKGTLFLRKDNPSGLPENDDRLEVPVVFAKVAGDEPPSFQACTEEAKLCPDGSYVGRTGPNCEFAPCP
ncbi:Gmad2 immunoglobulin-like domain-containing protein [Patescibacteria group bacterium]|nr:Gmad2 immunoglobulin-like domain-containing protein [Patescibacteria group bacterium]MBU2220147.1 Gmad2 immunoglobulin-like domain-containing protein [Patescibacteria group bacterium]MBU2265207.1 Gmad2 immunoglobulin-like domain-containing protein [Patescibacteria group bacterium]